MSANDPWQLNQIEDNRRCIQAMQGSLGSLADGVTNLRQDIGQISNAIDETNARLIRVEVKVESKRDLCPFREDISRASNNIRRLEHSEERLDGFEKRMRELEVAMARSGFLSGAAGSGVVAAIGGLLYGIGKAAGWW
jgi:peptidoglycan hydrolase CwlO-like protein